MNPTTLAQWQFGITTVYHFFFVPLTLGLSVLVAIMETLYVRSGEQRYK
jgi:cytochrome d ubiquinol oxidase subunit I